MNAWDIVRIENDFWCKKLKKNKVKTIFHSFLYNFAEMSKGSGDEDDLTPKVTEVSTNTPKINSSITVIQIEASSETIDGDDDIIHSSWRWFKI